jgi:hypothetical protein
LKVRNNLPHAAALFPTSDEIERCCQTLKEVIGELEKLGLIPIIFANVRLDRDSFRREKVISKDYGGREIVWFRSPSITCLHKLPELQEPQILVPGIRIPNTSEILRFAVKEDSEFTRMWESYPRRKRKSSAPAPSGQGDHASVEHLQ